jgi:hypothetical protein
MHSFGIADPSVDDSSTGRGVVLGRAATKLRSIETQPLTGGSTSRRLVRSSSGLARPKCFKNGGSLEHFQKSLQDFVLLLAIRLASDTCVYLRSLSDSLGGLAWLKCFKDGVRLEHFQESLKDSVLMQPSG